eukprot:4875931-Pyramimonas_sp.AAC.1
MGGSTGAGFGDDVVSRGAGGALSSALNVLEGSSLFHASASVSSLDVVDGPCPAHRRQGRDCMWLRAAPCSTHRHQLRK